MRVRVCERWVWGVSKLEAALEDLDLFSIQHGWVVEWVGGWVGG